MPGDLQPFGIKTCYMDRCSAMACAKMEKLQSLTKNLFQ